MNDKAQVQLVSVWVG